MSIALVPAPKQGQRIRPYAKAPLEWHSSWMHVREAHKNLAFRLYVLSIGQGWDPPGIELDLSEDWTQAVLQMMCVHPRDRHNYARYLRELFDQGRIVYENGRLCVLALEAPRSAGHSLASRKPLADAPLTPSYPLADVSLRTPTPRNDSEPDTPLKEKEIKERERAGAHTHAHETIPLGGTTPYAIGHDFCLDVGVHPTNLDKPHLEDIGRFPEAERQRAKAAVRADLSTVKLYGGPRNIVKNWGKFSQGLTPTQKASAPRKMGRLDEMKAEGRAMCARLKTLDPESYDYVKLRTDISDLELRVRRLQAEVA